MTLNLIFFLKCLKTKRVLYFCIALHAILRTKRLQTKKCKRFHLGVPLVMSNANVPIKGKELNGIGKELSGIRKEISFQIKICQL